MQSPLEIQSRCARTGKHVQAEQMHSQDHSQAEFALLQSRSLINIGGGRPPTEYGENKRHNSRGVSHKKGSAHSEEFANQDIGSDRSQDQLPISPKNFEGRHEIELEENSPPRQLCQLGEEHRTEEDIRSLAAPPHHTK